MFVYIKQTRKSRHIGLCHASPLYICDDACWKKKNVKIKLAGFAIITKEKLKLSNLLRLLEHKNRTSG